MGRVRRHWYLALGAFFVLVAAAVAGGLVLAFGSGSSKAAPTKAEYFQRVATICRFYGPKLDKIEPPADISVPSEIITSVTKVLPLLRAESNEVGRLEPPRELRAKLARWTQLNDSSLSELAVALRAGRQKSFAAVGTAYVKFVVTGVKAQRLGRQIGFPRPPC